MSDKYFAIEAVPEDAGGRNIGARGKDVPSSVRKDAGRLHCTRHGILSKNSFQALVNLGENPRTLRQIERGFREEVRPRGPVANMLFDRMFCAYLSSVLAKKLEARALSSIDQPVSQGVVPSARISIEEQPTVIFGGVTNGDLQTVPVDLCSQLALVQKYDGHYSREMIRYLGLLIALKNGGELGLAKFIGKWSGPNKTFSEG